MLILHEFRFLSMVLSLNLLKRHLMFKPVSFGEPFVGEWLVTVSVSLATGWSLTFIATALNFKLLQMNSAKLWCGADFWFCCIDKNFCFGILRLCTVPAMVIQCFCWRCMLIHFQMPYEIARIAINTMKPIPILEHSIALKNSYMSGCGQKKWKKREKIDDKR